MALNTIHLTVDQQTLIFTEWIEQKANAFIADGLRGVSRVPFERARNSSNVHPHQYLDSYVNDLPSVIDLEAIRESKVHIGVDPLGGASVAYWDAIGERYRLNLEVVNHAIDPTFRFMTVDWDGQIRMDPSSVYAMASMVGLKERFDVAFASDSRCRSARNSKPQLMGYLIRINIFRLLSLTYSPTVRNGRSRLRSARLSSAAA